jgi:hypothetical protein
LLLCFWIEWTLGNLVFVENDVRKIKNNID